MSLDVPTTGPHRLLRLTMDRRQVKLEARGLPLVAPTTRVRVIRVSESVRSN